MKALQENILNILKKHNGVLKTSELKSYNISLKKVQRMAYSGQLERIANGLYLHPDFLEDEYYVTSYRVPKGIFSYDSALYLHRLSDENPVSFTLTIPSGWNSSLIKEERYKFYYLKEELWLLGQEFVKTPYGNVVPVYSAERTLAEMIAKIERFDRDLILSSLKEGLRSNRLDILKLLNFGEVFKKREMIRAYLEVIR